MGREARRTISEPATIRALAHPVRLDLLTYLMANGPATASRCARAVGDTPSNCSYHLRALAKVGLVAPDESRDGRERPWRALVTGYDVERHEDDPTSPAARRALALAALTLQRDQRRLRDYLARRERVPRRWRDVDGYANYVLRLNPDELRDLGERLDALIRPYIAATRDDAPPDAEQVQVGLYAFPLEDQP
jgi:DNA-binding transcriptional ArsR family regulator